MLTSEKVISTDLPNNSCGSCQASFFYDHKVKVVPGAVTGIVRISNFHALRYWRPFDFQVGRNTAFCQMQVDLVGPGGLVVRSSMVMLLVQPESLFEQVSRQW